MVTIPLQHSVANIVGRVEAAHLRATSSRDSSGMTAVEKGNESRFVRQLRIEIAEVIVRQVTGPIVPVEVERHKCLVRMVDHFVAVVIRNLCAVTRVKEHALIALLRVFQYPGEPFTDGRASCTFIQEDANVFGTETNLLQRGAHFKDVVDAALEAIIGVRVIFYADEKGASRRASRNRSGGALFSQIFCNGNSFRLSPSV